MKTKEFLSEFNRSILVTILCKDDSDYKTIKPAFNKYGFGFMVPNQNMVFIDGELGLNKHILKWIEAHEIAHFILGHGKANSQDEIDADRLAYHMLDGKGYHKAAQLVKDKFIERHGIELK